MYKKILIGLAAMMFSVSAFGQLQLFEGYDPNAGPNDPRPNSDDARDDFLAALPNGPVVTEDFESYKSISDVCGVTINNGVTVLCDSNDWDWNGPSGPNNNGENDTVGYNTTQGGRMRHYLDPDTSPADFTYKFAQPVQAAGFYATGVATTGGRVLIRFNDGSNQVAEIPGGNAGGASFIGFTHPGKFIAAIDVRITDGGDLVSIDDITVVQTNDTAFFNVTKDFEPDSTGDIDVSITCNNGIPSYDEATVTGGDPVGHTFVITNLDGADVSCVVEELNPTSGYKTLYNGADTSVGCTWEPVLAGDYSCEITNIAQDVTFGMTKVWDLTGAGTGGDAVVREARLTIACDRRITGTDPVTDIDRNVAGDWVAKWDSLSTTPSASYEVSVRARNGEPTCTASEKVFDSAIEQSVEGECVDVEIAVGGSEDSCVITNTVFFEGIPTLSQYGLAIMALLMLGVGFVGFRRFI